MKQTAYVPPPTTCALLADLATRAGGWVTIREKESVVEYALPGHASAEVRDFLQARASVQFEPALVARLPGGRVFGSGAVLSPDGQAIARDVSLDFGKAFSDHWLLTYWKIPPPTPLGGTTAVIATTLGNGYSHWLLEELPRLLALPPDGAERLIAHAASGPAREAIERHGFCGSVIAARRDAHFTCEQLIVPSLGRLNASTLAALEKFTASLRGAAPGRGERLYISREKARRRQVTNEPELWAELSARGFVKLHLEELSWAQQINAFANAKVIVAPHGAGLANLVFCAPGTKIIELFHRSYVNVCYWQLAVLRQLDYRPLVPDSAEPLAQTLNANRADVTADLAQVRRALQS